jgi:hypothetical protein
MAQSIAKACGRVNGRNGVRSGPSSAVRLQQQPGDDNTTCRTPRTPLTPLQDLNHPRVPSVPMSFFSIAAANVTRYSMPRRKHRLFGSTSPAYCRLPSERAAISRLSRPLDRFGQRWQEKFAWMVGTPYRLGLGCSWCWRGVQNMRSSFLTCRSATV